MVPVILLWLLMAVVSFGQNVTFTQHVVAEQDFVSAKAQLLASHGTAYPWNIWGMTFCDVDLDGYPDLLVGQHAENSLGFIFKNNFATSPTVTDITNSLIGDGFQFPIADKRAHCRDFDKDGKMDIAGFRNEGTLGRASLLNNWPNPMTRITPMMYNLSGAYGNRPSYLKPAGIADITNDGFLDVSNRYTDWIFNPALRTFTQRVSLFTPPVLPQAVQDLVNATPTHAWRYYDCCDVTGDGLTDVLLSGSKSYTNTIAGNHSRLLVRQPDGSLVDETVARGLPTDAHVSMIEDVLGSPLPELALSRGTAPGLYLNNAGTFTRIDNPALNTDIGKYTPYNTDVDAVSFRNNGQKDLIIHRDNPGALLVYQHTGTNYTLALNAGTGGIGNGCTVWRADGYDVGDADNNGSLDLVVGYGSGKTCATRIIVYLNTSVTGPPPPPPPDPLVITSSTPLPGATPGGAYSHTLTATGGVEPYEWAVVSGLPDGLTLSTAGEIAGAVGTQNVRVKVVDSLGVESETNLDLPLIAGTCTEEGAGAHRTILELRARISLLEENLSRAQMGQSKRVDLINAVEEVAADLLQNANFSSIAVTLLQKADAARVSAP